MEKLKREQVNNIFCHMDTKMEILFEIIFIEFIKVIYFDYFHDSEQN